MVIFIVKYFLLGFHNKESRDFSYSFLSRYIPTHILYMDVLLMTTGPLSVWVTKCYRLRLQLYGISVHIHIVPRHKYAVGKPPLCR